MEKERRESESRSRVDMCFGERERAREREVNDETKKVSASGPSLTSAKRGVEERW